MCDEWSSSFQKFYDWCISNGFQRTLQLDRKDGNMGYSPSNCRWTTPLINQRNRTKNKKSTSQYFHVYLWKNIYRKKRYYSIMSMHGKNKFLGNFITEIEAAMAADLFIIENNLEGYNLNFKLHG
jgi:hypothetical protein